LLALTLLFAALFVSGVVGRKPHERADAGVRTATVTRTVSSEYWHGRFVRMRHLAYQRKLYAHRLHKTLLAQPSVTEAIELACTVYGNCATLWRRARCESQLNPNARNGSEASGLLQFLPSTWRSTPFARFNVFSPYANALAAGWMIGPAGRGGEWACR
jgi:hypothetical protein